MAGGYPNLFPAYFIEFDDPCSGPSLYRSQPSRENVSAPTLNDYMNKYTNADITNFDFTNLLTYIKYISRHWKKIPNHTKKEIRTLLKESNSPILKDKQTRKRMIDYFTNTSEDDTIKSLENMVRQYAPDQADSIQISKKNNMMNIFTLVVVAIVALVIGFLIACVCTN